MTTKVLYIAGLGRSGSTLLSRLLGQVAGISVVGEAHHVWRTGAPRAAADELCGCGRTYAECGFWPARLRAVFDGDVPLAAMQGLADRVARIRRIRRLERGGGARFEAAVAEYAEVWRRLYAEISMATGSRWVLDASKDMGPLFFLSRVPGIEVTVVHLVRDPRGVAYSWSQRKRRPEFVGRDVWMNRHGALDVAWRWTYSNRLAERAKALFPAFLRLRYEDFVEDPKAALLEVCAVAGIDAPDLGFIHGDRAEVRRSHCTLSGNPMRFDQGVLTVRPDRRWLESYPPLSRSLVGGLTWPLRRRYGYGGAR
jgi:Sulfotransferase family